MSKWNFVESDADAVPLGDKHIMITSTNGLERRMVFNRERFISSNDKFVSIAIDERDRTIGVFKPQGGTKDFEMHDTGAKMVHIVCTAALVALGFTPGLYAVERGSTEGLLFTVSVNQKLVDFPDGTPLGDGATMTTPRSTNSPKVDRMKACQDFVAELEGILKNKVVRKERHKGYSLFVRGGKAFGYIRMNERGSRSGNFIVYIFDRDYDDQQRFAPQPGNENSLKFTFDPATADREYVLAVFEKAYRMVSQKQIERA